MIELQDIFSQYGETYRQNHKLLLNQLKTMRAIENCRTSVLGAHIDECDECGYTHISYNSCRNRHCPKCQTLKKERWIDARKDDLLNVGYFHVVFTIPDTLNQIAYQNQEIVYKILFKAAAETLSELASDKKYLGAQIGITEILHTWGQNLIYHPHVHCIVPGGGLGPLDKWVNSRKKFFIPVKVLSRKFRGKFLYYLKLANLDFYGSISYLHDRPMFDDFVSSLYQKEWIVYCKPPFKNAGCVVEYLGRYTHRVAISNNRILKMENGMITFKWRDYRDGNKLKYMELSVDEFIRRFLIHVLPAGFTKIRHYGLLSPVNKSTKLRLCKKLTNTFANIPRGKMSAVELLNKLTGKDVTLCPCCRVGHLARASPQKPETA
jgi:predicted Zn-ribbon and HTH transcriptional regulator